MTMRHEAFSAISATILSFLILLSSCGMEDYVYLYAPSDSSGSTTSLTRIVKHNTSNASSSVFKGYLLYYKIYGSSSSTTSPSSASSEASSIESLSSPDLAYSKLTSLGYKAILGYQSGTAMGDPIVEISSANASKYIFATFDLEGGNGSITIEDSSSSGTFSIVRAASDTSTSTGHKSFTDLSSATSDTDIDRTSGQAYYWIRIYAIAYGIDDSFANYYSLPCILADTVFLGAAGTK